MKTEMNPLHKPLPINPNVFLELVEQGQLCDTLQVALSYRLFERLETNKSAQQVATEMDWEQETTLRLLNVLVEAGYLTLFQGLYSNSPAANTYLRADHFLYLGHKLDNSLLPDSFGYHIVRCLQKAPDTHVSKEPVWDHERLRQIGVNALSGSIQSAVNACELPNDVKRVLDLGGGHGFYSIALAQKHPHLKISLFDLPQVVALAKQFITQFHCEEQIDLVAGNFLQDPIGVAYDAILCSNILHSDKRNIVLEKVKNALSPGGTMILRCRIDDCADNLSNALTKLYWQVKGGKELFTQAQWRGFLAEHGFLNTKTVDREGMFATMISNS